MPSVANLAVSLTARTGQFTRSMRNASRSIGQLRGAMGRLSGAASLVAGGGVGLLVGRSFQLIDTQAKVADRLSANQRQMAGLDLAARRAGVSTQTLQMGLQRMTRRIGEAAQGSGEAKDALKTLGLAAGDLVLLSADQQFNRVAEALSKVENGSQRVALAMKLFDSEGVALLNAIEGGAAGLAEAQKRAEQFGLAIDRVDAAKIEETNDAISDVRDVFTGLANQIAIQLAPLITSAAEAFVDWATDGETAARKVKGAINDFVLPAMAKIMDGWDFIAGGIRISSGLLKNFVADLIEAARSVPLLGGAVEGIASFFGADLEGTTKRLREAGNANIAEGAAALDRVFGVTPSNLDRLRSKWEGVIVAAGDRAQKKIESKPGAGAGAALLPSAAKEKALKVGQFQEVDLRRIVLGGAAGATRKQEVFSPQLDRIIELLRRGGAGGAARAV